uniref:Putative lsd one-like protein 2 n=1 Tax=Leavenworthia alabamica TaxID=310722 RepID=R9S7Q2_LEAAL|nr:putative lsd one-like protein 2 [Leavenworthia alabamica]
MAGAETEGVMEEIQTQKNEEQNHLDDEEEEEGPPPGWESSVLPPPIATITTGVEEMAQMVCGSCRRLLSYLKGSKRIKCSCCNTVNLVLEASEVGQVNCDNCKLLLMYPYGAPSVRCSSCNSLTDITENNKRPPWSEQQGPVKTLSSIQ